MPIVTTGCLKREVSILAQSWCDLDSLIFLLLETLDEIGCHHKVLLGEERVCCACQSSTSCSTHSMDVVFQLLRHVIVDYIRDLVNM